MINQVQASFRRNPIGRRFFSAQQTMVLAVSGGVDSMVLLDLCLQLPPAHRPRLVVAHVNHQLRAQSQLEEASLRRYCQAHHLTLKVAQWPRTHHPTHGVEAAARKFRYRFFARVMADQQATVLATAHHADDLAETFLMKLVRGGQLRELINPAAARPFGRGTLIRPLLALSKADLIAYARERKLTWFEDATNQDLTMTRNRYRHTYLPALAQENPHLITALGDYHQQLTDLLATVQPYLADLATQLRTADGGLDLAAFASLPERTQRTFLRYWFQQQGGYQLKEAQLRQAHQLLSARGPAQGELSLAGGKRLVRRYQWAGLKKGRQIEPEPVRKNADVVKLGRWYQLDGGLAFGLWPLDRTAATGPVIWLTPAQLPLRRRRWQPGDRLALKSGGHQRVSRILIDQKVPREARRAQPVVVDQQGQVVWLVGLKRAWLPPRPGTVPVCMRLQAGKE